MNTIKKIRLFIKYHILRNPSDGPTREIELGIKPLKFDIDNYYKTLNKFKKDYYFDTLKSITYKQKKYPILLISNVKKSKRSTNVKHLLIVSGVHGNEQAPLLAIPKLLQTKLYSMSQEIQVSILVPANPVGVAHFSRYNAKGYDINRDFSKFETQESKVIKQVVDTAKPDFVLGLHEGPQEGIFLYANKYVKKSLIITILGKLKENNVLLAPKDYFGRKLAIKGYFPIKGIFSILIILWRMILSKTTLSTYLTDLRIPEITPETSWKTVSKKQRVQAQLIVIHTVLEILKND